MTSTASTPGEFARKYGPWALIAGASEGIGAEFAIQLAARGLNLIMLARRPGPLQEHAERLAAQYRVQTRPVPVDLGADDPLPALRPHIGDLEIGFLVYNAAFSLIGPFFEQELDDKLRIINVNCRSPLMLVHELGRPMVERGRGGIILMSSLSALQGSPWISTYAATKAFDLILGEGLWGELHRHGVDVLAYAAGATRTPGFQSSRPKKAGWFSAPMEPGLVVEEALSSLGKQPSGIPGRANRIAAFFMNRLLSRRAAVEIMGRTTRAMYLK